MQKYQLDWKMRLLFWLMRRMPTINESNYAQHRAGSRRNPLGFLFRRFSDVAIENRSILGRGGNIPVRIYRPVQTGPLPVIVFFHSGRFVLCGLESHDPICRRLAVENRAVVLILTAEYDPLHDEGHLYAEHLAQSGVQVMCTRFSGMPHGFLSFGRLASEADNAYALIRQALQPFSIGISQAGV